MNIAPIVKAMVNGSLMNISIIDKNELVNDLNTLLEGLKLVGDFMDKTILKPNNVNYPISRNQFINSLKSLN